MKEQCGADGVRSNEKNWSELPQEILHLFSKKLSDFIHFRDVCKSWQLLSPITDPSPQLPWLLEHRQDVENAIIRFYCLSSGKVHTITCPGSLHARLEGPAYHYLLANHLGNEERYLLNPLTHDQISAPVVVGSWGPECWRYYCPDYIGPDPTVGGYIGSERVQQH